MPQARRLDDLVEGVEPVHPAIRVIDHPDSRAFALASVPDSLADVLDCATPERRQDFNANAPFTYGQAFGMSVRFRTKDGEAPVVRFFGAKRPTRGGSLFTTSSCPDCETAIILHWRRGPTPGAN